jgi:hypothetical protein
VSVQTLSIRLASAGGNASGEINRLHGKGKPFFAAGEHEERANAMHRYDLSNMQAYWHLLETKTMLLGKNVK